MINWGLRAWSGGDAPEYLPLSGRELYESRSITGLNRIPIITLTGFVLSGARVSGSVPVPLETIVEAMLIDGPVVLIGGEMASDIVESRPNSFTQLFRDVTLAGSTMDIHRVYQRTPAGWAYVDYRHYGGKDQTVIAQGDLPADAVTYWYNAVTPTGILYPSQDTYHRIEEIARSIRTMQSGPSTKTIVGGHIRNQTQAAADLVGNDPVVFIPGDVTVDKMADTGVVNQLISEFDKLLPMWYQLTHIVDTASPIQRPSGADRQLVLAPMRRFVELLRDQITNVLAMFGASWSSERLHTTDVAERQAALLLLKDLRDSQVIDQAEFTDQAQKLV